MPSSRAVVVARGLIIGLGMVVLSLGAKAQPGEAPSPAATIQPAPKAPAKKPVYDETADAKQQIAAALAKAKAENQRVLIQWGGNWCTWCLKLHHLLTTDAELAAELRNEYQVVHIDAGKPKGKNVDLAHSYSATPDKDGYPFLTILDADGKPIANTETGGLEKKDANGESVLGEGMGHDPKKVMAFLKDHQAPAQNAEALLSDGLKRAQSESKLVFVHFGAPWCPWCHRLDDWMRAPANAELLNKDFIDLKIDVDRMTGGKAVMTRFRGDKAQDGIPWFAFLDASGKAVAVSEAKGVNIGFPAAAEEVAHFESMLAAHAKKMSADDRKKLVESLKADKPASAGH